MGVGDGVGVGVGVGVGLAVGLGEGEGDAGGEASADGPTWTGVADGAGPGRAASAPFSTASTARLTKPTISSASRPLRGGGVPSPRIWPRVTTPVRRRWPSGRRR